MKKEFIYQIFCGNTDEEFYTFDIPIIESDQVKCSNLIKKGIIKENAIGQEIEEYFKLEVIPETKKEIKSFGLKLGFVVKLMESSTLTWLDATEKDARDKLKDRVLQYYQSVVPNLITTVNELKKELKERQYVDENNVEYIRQDHTGQKRKNLLIP